MKSRLKKLLKKKAFKKTTLYHITSARHFIDMMNEGQITPGGYNGNISGGGHVRYYELNKGQEHQGDETTLFAAYIDECIEKQYDNIEFNGEIKQKINELKKSDENWGEVQISVIKSRPSHNEIGVYLKKTSHDTNDYGEFAVKSYANQTLCNTAVTLEIEVDEDALGPDLDDGKVNPESDKPQWQQTLDFCGQCIHNGPISIDQIVSVSFNITESKQYEQRYIHDDFIDMIKTHIKAYQEMKPNEAYEKYNQILEEFTNYDPNEINPQEVQALLSEEGITSEIMGNEYIIVSDMQSFLNLTDCYDFRPFGCILRPDGAIEANIVGEKPKGIMFPPGNGIHFEVYNSKVKFDCTLDEFFNSGVMNTNFLEWFTSINYYEAVFTDTFIDMIEDLPTEFENKTKVTQAKSRLKRIIKRNDKES